MSNANDLRNRVAIYKYDRSNNAAGTPIEQWLFYKYTYASIRVLSGSLVTDPAPGTVAEASIEIIVRYDRLIDYNCKIVYLNNSYRINYIEQLVKDGFLRLNCTLYNENHPVGNE